MASPIQHGSPEGDRKALAKYQDELAHLLSMLPRCEELAELVPEDAFMSNELGMLASVRALIADRTWKIARVSRRLGVAA